MFEVTIGKCLLSSLLRERDLTQIEFCEQTGMSPTQLSAYINNRKRMSLQTAYLISAALGCSMEDLYSYDNKGLVGRLDGFLCVSLLGTSLLGEIFDYYTNITIYFKLYHYLFCIFFHIWYR
ncbi:helix-turn-helix domain-containing protein [Peribacillus loiseleuriae]|uniref:helix-turn-helix domain-containing protein n=1 Tax=Peribacillus loiseleuriae TaxID=1679170 RepID=UPI0009E26025